MRAPTSLILLAALGLCSCTEAYTYVPTTLSSATVAGKPTAEYSIVNHEGDVQLASLGFEEASLTPSSTHALHVKMLVKNQGLHAWTIDPKEQRLAMAGAAPIHARELWATPATIVVPPGATESLDLYFPLPAGVRGALDVPRFDVLWTVHAKNEAVERRTSFQRYENGPADESQEDVTGRWGGSTSPSR